MKRGQSAIELMIIIGVILTFFIIFISIIHSNQAEKRQQKEKQELMNIALDIREEIEAASKTLDGYNREFMVPKKVIGNNYTIEKTENYLQMKSEGNAFVITIRDFEGEIKKGVNVIERKNGKIYLNE